MGKGAPSLLLRYLITAQDLIHLAHLQSWLYNTNSSFNGDIISFGGALRNRTSFKE